MRSLLKITLLLSIFVFTNHIQSQNLKLVEYDQIISGAQQFDVYKSLIEAKNIAVVANQASMAGDEHLIDFLLKKGVSISRVFSPEHGFRGKASAGEKVDNKTDSKTGLQIISLYGSHKKPSPADLENIDLVIFDLQDVGVRFYTYISTLTYVMEACAENDISLIILDRPNPNGFYIDGPVLQEDYKSFVGMHKVPVVYGMTIGEYGKMVNGEEWLEGNVKCDLHIVPMQNYKHNYLVKLPIRPSPNLPNWKSVYLYPSLCFFEGTVVSAGRGTDYPFQTYGHPQLMFGSFIFTPESKPGAKYPKFEGQACNGQFLSGYAENYAHNDSELNLLWLIESYKALNSKDIEFFNDYFNTLAGNDKLRKHIEEGWTEEKIKQSWKKEIDEFKKIRKNYLIYD